MHTQRTKTKLNNAMKELASMCFLHSMEEIEHKYIIVFTYNTVHSCIDIYILDNVTCEVIASEVLWNIKTAKKKYLLEQINTLKKLVTKYITLNRKEWNLSKTK